jgi:hypothetical protein
MKADKEPKQWRGSEWEARRALEMSLLQRRSGRNRTRTPDEPEKRFCASGPPERCLKCGSEKVARIVYGPMPFPPDVSQLRRACMAAEGVEAESLDLRSGEYLARGQRSLRGGRQSMACPWVYVRSK